ncbi:hypothetical protein G6F16_003868 [Rhizopus arrhizus]|nr:hypothetical protein G6F21_002772 [Rhizopus arrhizus]KAG0799805.1 hypothetical protein G6F22_002864 [Rhizopus arrhizus]KAG0816382.1 hypothetical protein G6F20_003253 [Rhizopus arrhizus]KAG0837279.1 hypothetical protein G6F19_003792 [Rhizopus arrhizus]KAG0840464.1 hypothetical protein G6F18_003654 [Rhizopus arrhizus]
MQSTKAAELRTLLNGICDARRAPSQAAIRLEHILQDHKQTLIKLLDNLPKNAEHRSVIQNGKAFINSEEYKVNKEFTKEVIFLSDQLDLEEYESSRLLLEGTRQAHTTLSPAIDTAVYLYHAERGYILAILNTIFECIKDDLVDKHIRSVFLDYMIDICLKSNKGFVSKILKSLNDLNTNIKSISKNASQPQPLQQQQQQQVAEVTKFREDTIVLRIDQLKEERISLVQILYHVASLFWLPEADLLTLINLIQTTNLLDSASPYLLTTLLAAISPRWMEPNQVHYGIDITAQDDTMKKIHNAITTNEYKVEGVKGVVLLQWALFNVKKSSISDRSTSTFKLGDQAATSLVKKGIELDAFGFLNEYLLHFKQKDGNMRPNTNRVKESSESIMVINGLTVDPNDYTKFHADITNDFQPIVEHELELLTDIFILKMSSLLHQLKADEEDAIYQVGYPIEVNSSYTKDDSKSGHLEAFLILLATIYRNRLNAGSKFWTRENGLFAFVKWLFDIKVVGTIRAAFDVLGSISTGDQCASHAYDVLSMGIVQTDISNSHLFSWGKLFATLQFYSEAIHKTLPGDECPSIPQTEEEVLCKLIYLCQQVVQYSSTARAAIWNSASLNAHVSIINMISCPTSVSLRVHLYNLLAAFCSSWGGGVNGVGRTISLQVWNSLEGSDFISASKKITNAGLDPVKDTAKETLLNSLLNPSTLTKPAQVANAQISPTSRILLPDQTSGFLTQFDSEKNSKSYTKTLALLKLMASLIHKQSEKDALISGFSAFEQSIPPYLGCEHRSPGASPYLSLVIDHVFLNLNNLQYSNPDGKWQLADACLKVIENSIMSFNLEALCDRVNHLIKKTSSITVNTSGFMNFLQNANVTELKQFQSLDMSESLLPFVTHPGFDIMVRILSGGSLIAEIFKVIGLGREETAKVAKAKKKKSFYLQRSLTRCLRILRKAMATQNVFVNVFIPQLDLCSEKLPAGEFKLCDCVFPQVPSVLTSVGKLMLFNTQVITQIALLVNSDDHEELCALSVAILSALSLEPEANLDNACFPNHVNLPMGGIGTQLPSILFASSEATSIILGFSERLEIESTESITYDNYKYDINTIPFWLAEKTLGYDYSYEDESVFELLHSSLSIRTAILDLLLICMQKDRPSPTLAEFLLGFDILEIASKGSQYKSIPASYEQRPQLTCMFSILNMLRASNAQESKKDGGVFTIQVHPLLTEKCYRLLYYLCSKESTSTATLYYLRTNGDDFLINQLQAISPRIDSHLIELEPCFSGIVKCMTKGDVPTDFFTLKSTLDQHTWLFKLITLELHTRKTAGTTPLLNLLYGYTHSPSNSALDPESQLSEQMRSMHLQMNADYQQPNWNLLEIINSLELTWVDNQLNPTLSNIAYFKHFDSKNFEIEDPISQCKLYDIRNVYKFLRYSQKLMASTMSEEEIKTVEEEMGRILQSLMAKNRDRQIAFSRLRCLQAWKQMVEITLFDCLDVFSFDIREKITYDLLSMIWTKLEEENYQAKDILKSLSELILSILARLKKDQNSSDNAQYDLPIEKLRQTFIGIVQFMCKNSVTVDIRNNLHTALVIFMQYASRFNKNASLKLIDSIDNESQQKLLNIISKITSDTTICSS